jgi:hypothetical protein
MTSRGALDRAAWLCIESGQVEQDVRWLINLLAAGRRRPERHPMDRCEHCRAQLPHVLADCDACPEGRAAAARYRRRQAALAGDPDIRAEDQAKRRADL